MNPYEFFYCVDSCFPFKKIHLVNRKQGATAAAVVAAGAAIATVVAARDDGRATSPAPAVTTSATPSVSGDEQLPNAPLDFVMVADYDGSTRSPTASFSRTH